MLSRTVSQRTAKRWLHELQDARSQLVFVLYKGVVKTRKLRMRIISYNVVLPSLKMLTSSKCTCRVTGLLAFFLGRVSVLCLPCVPLLNKSIVQVTLISLAVNACKKNDLLSMSLENQQDQAASTHCEASILSPPPNRKNSNSFSVS